MPSYERIGLPAMRDYRSVEFSHIEVAPGAAATLTADPWSYARAHLSQARQGKKGSNAQGYQRALHYTRLAEGFYAAMDGAETRTKGVLAYYGMLNLVKAYLSINRVELETVIEHHGMTVPIGKDRTIRLFPNTGGGNIQILGAFAASLGTPITGQIDIEYIEVCAQIPELHQLLFAGGHIKRRKFLPIQIAFRVTEDRRKLFAEYHYDKGHEGDLPIRNFHKGERARYLRRSIRRENLIVHQTVATKPLSKKNWPTVYRNYLRTFNGADLASILTRQGYRYYCDLEPRGLHHLCYSLISMFFIGTISRYRPTTVEKTFAGRNRPIATEALSLVPHQFCYQMVSRLTDSLCVVPYAQLR